MENIQESDGLVDVMMADEAFLRKAARHYLKNAAYHKKHAAKKKEERKMMKTVAWLETLDIS